MVDLTPMAPEFITDNTPILYNYVTSLWRDRCDHPDASDAHLPINFSDWACHSYEDIGSHFLYAAANCKQLETDPHAELSVLAVIIMVDCRDSMMEALADVDYTAISIAFARAELQISQPPTKEGLICCKLLLWSWKVILETSKKRLRNLRFVKALLDQDVFFLLEAYIVAPRRSSANSKFQPGENSSSHILASEVIPDISPKDFTIITETIGFIFETLGSNPKHLPSLQRCLLQISIIHLRATADPSASRDEKLLWKSFVGRRVRRAGGANDWIPRPPEFVCGRPGCSSLDAAFAAQSASSSVIARENVRNRECISFPMQRNL
ncbi:hypothetical protein DL93DRAFT_135861 [Clavulina sp. PMI_390]|nr:hypothetical protein DL93DRAFT_135861 [Clavulina sp. PMI_390]